MYLTNYYITNTSQEFNPSMFLLMVLRRPLRPKLTNKSSRKARPHGLNNWFPKRLSSRSQKEEFPILLNTTLRHGHFPATQAPSTVPQLSCRVAEGETIEDSSVIEDKEHDTATDGQKPEVLPHETCVGVEDGAIIDRCRGEGGTGVAAERVFGPGRTGWKWWFLE